MIKRLLVALLALTTFGFTPIVAQASGVSPPSVVLADCGEVLNEMNDDILSESMEIDCAGMTAGGQSSLCADYSTAMDTNGYPQRE